MNQGHLEMTWCSDNPRLKNEKILKLTNKSQSSKEKGFIYLRMACSWSASQSHGQAVFNREITAKQWTQGRTWTTQQKMAAPLLVCHYGIRRTGKYRKINTLILARKGCSIACENVTDKLPQAGHKNNERNSWHSRKRTDATQ